MSPAQLRLQPTSAGHDPPEQVIAEEMVEGGDGEGSGGGGLGGGGEGGGGGPGGSGGDGDGDGASGGGDTGGELLQTAVSSSTR